ncbi:hypothetical protein ARHIZOSPH14_29580 [Agromyces rhizosphaerae]|uniref:DUF2231 domain-containing protein n=1 Tax=Agromyces rhizosphaerae TaxID=88374 RepID=A0A9W6CZ94_9MICO|nr:hypothetical protein [Agromyces rhizosphaerae]GLI28716.1 hypothetical protein ARHIZOSPH14_29580 [Agromyces rhizosphaerae]
MDPFLIAGLPAHVLLVHAVVIAVPVVALGLIVAAAWPAARRALWIPLVVVALGNVVLVWLAAESGEWLEERVPPAPLIEEHTELGEGLMPWVSGLAGLAVLLAVWHLVARSLERREQAPSRGIRLAVGIVGTVLAVAVGTGATIATVLIGESGSRAVWEGSFSEDPLE